MNKFKTKVAELSLAAGGSHYPTVNIHLQEAMVKLVVEECINSINNITANGVYTTYDAGVFDGTKEQVKRAIKDTFGL